MSSVADAAAPAGPPGQVSLADLDAAADVLAGLAAGLVPEAVPLCEVGVWWEEVQRLVRLAGSLETLLAARFAESGRWRSAGYCSAAEQIAASGGTAVGAARELLAASQEIGSLPGTEAAVRAGDLSVAEITTITSAASANPEAEESLLGLVGRASLGELRQKALAAKVAADPDPDTTHRRIYSERRLSWRTDAEGAWNLHARGAVDDGARIVTALEPIIDRLFTDARRRGEPEPREAYAFDALLTATSGSAGENPGLPAQPALIEPAKPKPHGKTDQRFLALLRLDHAALVRGQVEGEELCEIAGLGPVPVRLARELLGESVLKLVITKGIDVVNITHGGRGPTAAQRIALAWTSPICIIEGCSRTRLEIHHTEPYAKTRHTRLGELDQVCDHHHDLIGRGWGLTPEPGPRRLIPPADRGLENTREGRRGGGGNSGKGHGRGTDQDGERAPP